MNMTSVGPVVAGEDGFTSLHSASALGFDGPGSSAPSRDTAPMPGVASRFDRHWVLTFVAYQ